MKDREMLELAAKAAGLTGECHLLTGDCSDPAEPGGFRYEHPDGGHDWWNPLMDDGDALRLAVKLKLRIEHTKHAVYVGRSGKGGADIACEAVASSIPRQEAARRAITRAAAQIGKEVK